MAMAMLRARFLLTSGHLVATCLVRMETASMVAYLSFALAIGNLFAGLDVYSPIKNAVHIFCHFVGGVCVCQMILHDLDPARYLWYVVLLTHLPSSLCILDTTAQRFLFKTAQHPY
ncbi:hypothetical protein, variant 1 [Phytophthora nicotianae CJ01A1]|uniref:Uncharacterized protein n=8 Tax=Phytophthora nicotianae TaxID=4792 RepID=W2Z6C5_PHYNI|nr:hypothetical protein, variant 1 [Phytophthora nicotianae]ETM43811.1 hypothetical protein, variant 1 [Phytophthora nicotianae]ETO72574.1 hypothetical protein, variant 1 [Phytophthora nicotianae P1976]ETP13687.1 hypothetical protein, variant 1 [Phytophthora nicotianae CJ01A1]ETP41749.1 hypothetical protein, variant 1 [Phytophthora nicotianae P10297]